MLELQERQYWALLLPWYARAALKITYYSYVLKGLKTLCSSHGSFHIINTEIFVSNVNEIWIGLNEHFLHPDLTCFRQFFIYKITCAWRWGLQLRHSFMFSSTSSQEHVAFFWNRYSSQPFLNIQIGCHTFIIKTVTKYTSYSVGDGYWSEECLGETIVYCISLASSNIAICFTPSHQTKKMLDVIVCDRLELVCILTVTINVNYW